MELDSKLAGSLIVNVDPKFLQYGTSEKGLSPFLEADLEYTKSVEELLSRDTNFFTEGIYMHSSSHIDVFLRFIVMWDSPIFLDIEAKLL